ncbi:MAG: hypothetical protein M1580_02740 [Candidatus Parvarchaeota archaeon]|nr:hypothetical protein [Candidatus Parvarchaeota archaeon]
MLYIKTTEEIIFGLLSILGVFAVYYSLIISRALIKHKKDRAPLLSYLLNPERIRTPYFVFAGLFAFLTGLMAFLDFIDGGFNPTTALQYSTFFFGFIFAIVTAVFIILDMHFWYTRFKRFI